MTREQFLARLDKQPNGCWLFVGYRDKRGYGRMRWNGQTRLAHRVSLEIATGAPVPADKEACHHCDVPACVNPDHLYIGTHADNMRDMAVRSQRVHWQSKKTHCAKGHEFSPENTGRDAEGYRVCRICRKESGKRAQARRDPRYREEWRQKNRERYLAQRRAYRERVRARRVA